MALTWQNWYTSNIEERREWLLPPGFLHQEPLLASEKLQRLVETLRELRHFTYGIWIDLVFMHNAQLFFFHFFELPICV